MKRHSRRDFLSDAIRGAVAAGTGLLVLDPLLGLVAKAQLPPAASQGGRAYTAGRFGMEMDGQFAGWIESAAGGQAVLDQVETAPRQIGQIQSKQMPELKYEDLTVNCGTGMSRDFYEWIKANLEKQFVRKNCALVSCDFNYKLRSRMELFNASLTEVAFPACDASSKDAAKMTVRLAPESTRMTTGKAASTYQGAPKFQAVQKKWLPSNFRLKIDGLDCSHVRKIEGITAKFPSSANQVGVARLSSATATPPSVSNLMVSAPESREFFQWYEDFVVKGNSGQGKEKSGTLDYLSPDLRESIFSLSFHNLRILKLVASPLQPGNGSSRLVTAEMNCSDVGFSYGPAALA